MKHENISGASVSEMFWERKLHWGISAKSIKLGNTFPIWKRVSGHLKKKKKKTKLDGLVAGGWRGIR